MKKILGVAAALVLAAGVLAFTTSNGPATVITGDGCWVADANGALYWDGACRIQIVTNDNGFMVNAKGQLPEGAPLPEKALHRSIVDLGFSACYVPGDRGETVTTPSGNFNVSCHPAH